MAKFNRYKNKAFGDWLGKCMTASNVTRDEVRAAMGYSKGNAVTDIRRGGPLSRDKYALLCAFLPAVVKGPAPNFGKTSASSPKPKSPEKLTPNQVFGAALKAEVVAAGMGQGHASRTVGYTSHSGIGGVVNKGAAPSEVIYKKMLVVFPALKKVPPPIFVRKTGRGPARKKVAPPREESVRVKRLSDAARMGGATGVIKPEGTFTKSFSRALVGLVRVDGALEQVKSFLQAARSSGLSLGDTLNEIESL